MHTHHPMLRAGERISIIRDASVAKPESTSLRQAHTLDYCGSRRDDTTYIAVVTHGVAADLATCCMDSVLHMFDYGFREFHENCSRRWKWDPAQRERIMNSLTNEVREMLTEKRKLLIMLENHLVGSGSSGHRRQLRPRRSRLRHAQVAGRDRQAPET